GFGLLALGEQRERDEVRSSRIVRRLRGDRPKGGGRIERLVLAQVGGAEEQVGREGRTLRDKRFENLDGWVRRSGLEMQIGEKQRRVGKVGGDIGELGLCLLHVADVSVRQGELIPCSRV